MYAITLREFGEPEVMEWAEVPDLEPGRGQVLIDVVATAVNRADVLQRRGNYPPPPGVSRPLPGKGETALACQPVASDQVLQEGDRLSITPVKIEGAR